MRKEGLLCCLCKGGSADGEEVCGQRGYEGRGRNVLGHLRRNWLTITAALCIWSTTMYLEVWIRVGAVKDTARGVVGYVGVDRCAFWILAHMDLSFGRV